ncbi:MAG TPA: pseudouridine synthase [Polyangia bacterium]|nr:pseudouridine synthase [Polyangia bacterium]
MTLRLQRFLAMAGVASRRRAEELIAQGVVRVNNRVVTQLGSKVDPERDRVTVSGRRVQPEDKVYLIMNKPAGTVATMSDPEGRPKVADLLPRHLGARVFPIGRLDWATAGALLFTNDGDLAQALVHPQRRIEKIYHAKLRGLVDEGALARLRRGVELEDGRTPPARVALVTATGKHTWVEIGLSENRPRQVPRMCEAIGHPVLRLIRVAFADIGIEGLPEGQTRELSDREISDLRRLVGAARPKRLRARGARKHERS